MWHLNNWQDKLEEGRKHRSSFLSFGPGAVCQLPRRRTLQKASRQDTRNPFQNNLASQRVHNDIEASRRIVDSITIIRWLTFRREESKYDPEKSNCKSSIAKHNWVRRASLNDPKQSLDLIKSGGKESQSIFNSCSIVALDNYQSITSSTGWSFRNMNQSKKPRNNNMTSTLTNQLIGCHHGW